MEGRIMGTKIEVVGYNIGRWWRVVLLQPSPKDM